MILTRQPRVRPAMRAVLAALTAVVLVVSWLGVGYGYLFCRTMDRAMTRCCCADSAPFGITAGHDPTQRSSSLKREACCEKRRADAVTASGRLTVEEVGDTETVASAPPRWRRQSLQSHGGFRAAHHARLEPGARAWPRAGPVRHGRRLAQLGRMQC